MSRNITTKSRITRKEFILTKQKQSKDYETLGVTCILNSDILLKSMYFKEGNMGYVDALAPLFVFIVSMSIPTPLLITFIKKYDKIKDMYFFDCVIKVDASLKEWEYVKLSWYIHDEDFLDGDYYKNASCDILTLSCGLVETVPYWPFEKITLEVGFLVDKWDSRWYVKLPRNFGGYLLNEAIHSKNNNKKVFT